MIFEKKGIWDKLNQHSVLLGYDLGEYTSQISFCTLNAEDPQTVSLVAGEEQFYIPTVLGKRKEVNQWFFGKEAIKNAQEKEGILINGLISKARQEETVLVEGTKFDAVELLALFIKRSFSTLNLFIGQSNIEALMITVDELDAAMVKVLQKVAQSLPIAKERIFFQSHEESTFQYMIHQPKELWAHEAAACDFTEDYLATYRMELNKKTVPTVAFMEKQIHRQMRVQNDEQLLQVLMALCAGHIINSIYLIGDKFKGEWCQASLNFLCRSRRVFQGNNFFSKGACFAIREKVNPSSLLTKEYVFLGADKLKTNIGMQVIREGTEAYQVLLNAGENWYHAKKEVDFILESGNVISLILTSLNERESKIADITLSGLPVRPNKATRMHMEVELLSEDKLCVTVKDMGFGELFASSGLEWKEEFNLE